MTTSRSGLLPQIILSEVIFEKFKGSLFLRNLKAPCGHANPSFGAFVPNYFCRMSLFGNLKAPAGMTTRRPGLLPQIIFVGCHFLEI